MKLVASDYSNGDDYVIDTQTENASFTRYAVLLKNMGIKNWMWPLVTLDKRIVGVNPHDPLITLDQRLLIARECRRNPIYAIRECIRIPAGSGGKFNKFLASRSNMASLWSFFNNLNQFYMQPRQTGKTITAFTILVVCMNMVQRGSKNLLVTKDNKLRKNNVRDIKNIRDSLPPYLNPYDPGIDANNQEEITVKLYKNHLYTGVGSKDETTANNIGRGFTVPVAIFDEGPFTNNIQITMPAAIASGNRARPDAKAAGMPASYMMTTTAGERDRPEGRYCHDMQQNSCYFTEHLFDVPNRKTLYSVVRAGSASRNIMVNIEYNHLQLGLTNKWIYEKIVETGTTDEDAINRDFFNIWSQGRLRSPLTKEQKEAIVRGVREASDVEITKDNFIIRWYGPNAKDTLRNEPHTIGVDTSDAVGRDDTAYVFTNVRTGATTATVSFNEANLKVAAEWLADIMITYRKTLLVIEAKSSARSFIDTIILRLLAVREDPFKRIYNTVVQESREKRKDDFERVRNVLSDPDFYAQYKRDFGFMTTGSSRNTLYGSILSTLAKHGGMVVDKRLSDQLMSLVERNGRIDHVATGNDDMVIAKLMSLWVLIEGRNLAYYNIDVNSVLTAMPSNTPPKKLTPEEEAQKRIKSAMEARVKEIEERIRSRFPSPEKKRMLMNELTSLRNRYGFDERQSETYDALYEYVKEEIKSKEAKQRGGTTWRLVG